MNQLPYRSAVLSFAILVSGLLATGYFIQHERVESVARVRHNFDANCREIQAKIQVRMTAHEQILRSGAAVFADDNGVTRSEWHDFTAAQKINQTLPGIQGFGFATLVPRADLEQHVLRIRAEGFPAYHVWPDGERDIYSSIVFLEPFAGRNLRAFGYDMFTEPVRRAAMEQARDSDAVALSGKVKLVQEDAQDIQPGVLMYMPVYRRGAPHATVDERRAAIVGWVYSPYRMRDLITMGMLGPWDLAVPREIKLQIFDGTTAAPAALLYASHPDLNPAPAPAAATQRETVVEYAGSRWLLHFTMLDATGTAVHNIHVWWIFGAGTLGSIMLAVLTLSLGTSRHRARMLARLTTDLRLSDNRWKFALEGTGAGLWDWHVPTGTVFFSARWKAMRGFAEDEIGNNMDEWAKRVHPDDLAPAMAAVQAHLDGTTPSYTNEHRISCKDGSWQWIHDRGLVIERDAAGKPVRMIGMHEDISVRKQAEKALHESEESYRTLFDRANDGIFLLAADGRLVSVNQSFARMHGYSVAEMLQMHLQDLDTPATQQEAPQRIARLLAGEALSFEVEHYHKDGHLIQLEVSASLIYFGSQAMIQCFHRDITERKQIEMFLRQSRSAALNMMVDAVAARDQAVQMRTALEDKSAELERFLYTASHDLKSPVVTIRTFLGYLQQNLAAADAAKIANDLHFLNAAAGKLSSMLNELLEISRVGRAVNQPVRVTFRDLVDEALGAVAGTIAAHGVTVEVGGHAVTLLGDRPRLAEIWQNLLENACKFMGGQPAPRIEIGVEARAAATVFFVRDNGIGLDPRHHAKIFNLFEKLDPNADGTGFGLAIIKRIVEIYRGRVWVESKGAGHGACFYFTLPDALQYEPPMNRP